MEQNKEPVKQFFYSEKEWDRLGCGPLPEKRQRQSVQPPHANGNPIINGKVMQD